MVRWKCLFPVFFCLPVTVKPRPHADYTLARRQTTVTFTLTRLRVRTVYVAYRIVNTLL